MAEKVELYTVDLFFVDGVDGFRKESRQFFATCEAGAVLQAGATMGPKSDHYHVRLDDRVFYESTDDRAFWTKYAAEAKGQ